MPRTASFNLTEIKTSNPSNPQLKSVSVKNLNHVPKNIPPKKTNCCSFSCGWCVGLFICSCCIAFFVLLYLFPEEFIPKTIQIHFDGPVLIQKGWLRVYPNLPELLVDDDRIPGVYVINPSKEYVKEKIVPNLDDVFENYTAKTKDYPPHHYTMCWLENPSNPNSPCYFDPKWLLEDCNSKNDYGFKPSNGFYNPCILLRLEETDNWFPQTFHFKDVNPSWIHEYDPSSLPVGCHPTNDRKYDKAKPETNIYPKKGFSVNFFPQAFFNSDIYLAPMVMVQIKNLEVGKGFSIKCWIRARNSWHLRDSGEVTIHFRYPLEEEIVLKQKSPIEKHYNETTTSQSTVQEKPKRLHENP